MDSLEIIDFYLDNYEGPPGILDSQWQNTEPIIRLALQNLPPHMDPDPDTRRQALADAITLAEGSGICSFPSIHTPVVIAGNRADLSSSDSRLSPSSV